MKLKGIDVSRHQGVIDWDKVKSSGIQFAMIKAGGSDDGMYIDSKFEANYRGAKAAGIPIGAYWFVGKDFLTSEEGRKQAIYLEKALENKQFEYPIAVDVETTAKSKKSQATVATIIFCDELVSKGYYPMIYASDISGFKERLDLPRLIRFDKWVARYGNANSEKSLSQPQYVETYQIWQYTSKGSVIGINGNVDMDYCYYDYPSMIKSNGYNNFNRKLQNGSKTPDEVAEEVIAGLWGNGNKRKQLLTQAGYVYTEIQNIVNVKLYGVETLDEE